MTATINHHRTNILEGIRSMTSFEAQGRAFKLTRWDDNTASLMDVTTDHHFKVPAGSHDFRHFTSLAYQALHAGGFRG